MWLRQSTASQEISLGQFLDSTDGNTEEDGLTIANTDIKIRKGGTTTLANKNSGGATNISNGVYHATLDATDTDTLGLMEVYVHVAGALATKTTYMVLPATSYDALVTNGLNNLGGTAQTADHTAAIADIPTVAEFNARTLPAASYFDPASDTVANVTLVATTTTNTDMRGTDSANTVAPDNASIASILVDTNELQTNQGSWLTATGFATTAEIANVPTVAEFNARTLPSSSYFDFSTDQVIVGTNNDKSGYTLSGTTNVNVVQINGVTVVGSGISSDLWRA